MSSKVSLDGNKLTIEVSGINAKIIERTFPIASAFIEMYTVMTARLMLALATLGKEEMQSVMCRVEGGEDPGKVATEMMPQLTNDPALLFGDVEMPSGEEIMKILGMEDDTTTL